MTALVDFTGARGTLSLVGVPWAGAGAAPFRRWAEVLDDDVDVFGVRLAGRETRLGEPPARRLEDVLDPLADEILTTIDRPLALFGQCSGGLIAFELARRLRDLGCPHLVHVLVGGQEAPGHNVLPVLEGDLREQVAALGMGAAGVLVDDELFELLAPALEGDLATLKTYIYREASPLRVPITVFLGDDDDQVDRAALAPWTRETTAAHRLVVLPGDHIFSGVAWLGLARAIADVLRTTPR
jgi:surfactin synthase thioesterase subunit